MKYTLLLLLFLSLMILGCKKTDTLSTVTPPNSNEPVYFPPVSGTDWQTTTPASLNWNEAELNSLYPYLETKNTKAFIILKNGKIVAKKYFRTFTGDRLWYWASAGKTMTAFLVGIAQQEGLLNINNRSS